MRPRINEHRVRPGGPRGFSLAELMIALGVLAMGLLVIGAALPVGIQYSRDTINQATGQAAVSYALDLIEAHIAIERSVGRLNLGVPTLVKAPSIFVPRV